MKYPKKFMDAIADVLNELKGDFYCGEYGLLTFFDTGEIEGNVSGRAVAAEIKISDVYLNCAITIYPATYDDWKDKRYDSILRTLIHEMCHLLTEPLYRVGNKYLSEVEAISYNEIRERQTQRISIMIYPSLNIDKYIKILKG